MKAKKLIRILKFLGGRLYLIVARSYDHLTYVLDNLNSANGIEIFRKFELNLAGGSQISTSLIYKCHLISGEILYLTEVEREQMIELIWKYEPVRGIDG